MELNQKEIKPLEKENQKLLLKSLLKWWRSLREGEAIYKKIEYRVSLKLQLDDRREKSF